MNSQKQKLYLTIFSVIAINSALIFGGWWFTSTKIVSRFDGLQEARLQEATAVVESTLVTSLEKQLADNESALKDLREKFLQSDEGAIIDFIEQLENLAEIVDVDLSINSASALEEGSTFQLKVNLSGDFNEVMSLLAKIEEDTVVGAFTNIEMSGRGENRVSVTATLLLEQFSL